MKISLQIAVALILFPGIMFSQKIGDIITDRPDQTESPSTVPKNFIQVEAGAIMESHKLTYTKLIFPSVSMTSKIKTFTAPSVLLRYGIAKNIELRVGIEYNIRTFSANTESTNGSGPLLAGAKIRIIEESTSAPETAVLLNVNIPLGNSTVFMPNSVSAEYRAAIAKELTRVFSVSCNLGGEYYFENNTTQYLYTLSIGISPADKLSFFGESFGFFPGNEAAIHMLDGGITFLFKRNIQADLSAGFGLTENAPDYFIGAGISLRLPR